MRTMRLVLLAAMLVVLAGCGGREVGREPPRAQCRPGSSVIAPPTSPG
jgi:hypothetical protein